MKKHLLSIILLLIITSFAQSKNYSGSVDTTLIKKNLQYLSSDELKGREAGSPEETVAANYIAGEFARYGVKPLGDNGTYLQNFDMKVGKLEKTSTISFTGNNVKLKFLEDFLVLAKPKVAVYENLEKEIVFAGYGISAPEYEYDSYANLNCEGKTLVIISGVPKEFNELKPEEKSKFSNMQNKMMQAIKMKPAEIILLSKNKDEIEQYWQMLVKMSESEAVITEDDGRPALVMIAGRFEMMKNILVGEKISYEALTKQVEEGEELEGFTLKNKIKYELFYTVSKKTIKNVVGYKEGTDPVLKDEVIVIGAHYDHEGSSNGLVFNGANDNASGTVGVIEVANMLKDQPLKRSVVFALFTGEEKGLVGSNYFTGNHQIMPKVIANINLDMIGRGITDSIMCISSKKTGAKYTDLVARVNNATEKIRIDYKYDTDGGNYFYGSDHFGFYTKDKPVIFFFDNDKNDYHKPSDDYETMNFAKLFKITNLSKNIILEISGLKDKNELK